MDDSEGPELERGHDGVQLQAPGLVDVRGPRISRNTAGDRPKKESV